MIVSGRSTEVLAEIGSEVTKSDLFVVNLEAPLTNAGYPIAKSGPNLKCDPRCVELLRAGGVDVAVCANNHIGDFGPAAVMETLQLCDRSGVATVGAGANATEARKPLIVEKNGHRVAFLAFAENEFGTATDSAAGSNPLNPLHNIRDIAMAAKNAEITIVLIHGGNEHCPVPSPRMVQLYRAFAEAGASAIISGHTHCPQGIEMWNGVPIVYSLGNLIFDTLPGLQERAGMWWNGYMTRISFADGAALRLDVIPTTFAPTAEAVSSLSGVNRKRFLGYLGYLSEMIVDQAELNRCWDAWCAMKGPEWLKYLEGAVWPVNWEDEAAWRRLLAGRNAFTCEAHVELITHFLRMIEEKRAMGCESDIERMRQLQSGEWPQRPSL
jgi:poly-gamma-glutamate synthesis protein (capsule biosynthesis protein)